MTHIDVDECREEIDGCGQTCSNTVGSYTCSCRTGYRLASDGLTCNGITLVA
jgi:fibulin 1/2